MFDGGDKFAVEARESSANACSASPRRHKLGFQFRPRLRFNPVKQAGVTNCDHDHHDHGRPHSHQSRASDRLKIAFVVIATFMLVEVAGAVISGSLALLADAAHMFTDAFALGLAVVAQGFAQRPADDRLHFGYSRAQVLAAFANGVLLFAVIFWILVEAVRRFYDPVAVAWRPMLVVAGLGFAANAVAFFLLHGSEKGDVNVRGALLHVVSDLLGSVAAIVAAVAIMLGAPYWVDALLSVVVAGLIGRSAWQLVSETGHILLEGAPKNLNAASIVSDLIQSDEEILDVHDVRIWQLTPDESRVTLHVRIKNRERAQEALDAVKRRLEAHFGITQSTVQIELGPVCPDCETSDAVVPWPPDRAARRKPDHVSPEPAAPESVARRAGDGVRGDGVRAAP